MRNHTIGMIRRLTIGYRLLGCLSLILVQAACVNYQYIPPATVAGQQCVAACDAPQQACIVAARQRTYNEVRSCQMERSYRLNLCLANAGSDAERQDCARTADRSCQRATDTSACGNQYRQCYSACGGQVVEGR